jgi:hypothetical protein
MIVQDTQTGALHQVPDQLSGYGEYGERVVYDGLGNPVGRVAGIFDDIGKAVRGAVSAIPGIGPAVRAISAIPGIGPAVSAIPGIGPIASQLLPGGAMGPPAPPFPQIPGLPGFPTPQGFPMGSGVPMPAGFPGSPSFRPPWPAGWVRPPLPYTGLGPRRLYMRCAVWPGPRGLVPAFAQNSPPQGVPPQALPYMGGGRRHHRRHRR